MSMTSQESTASVLARPRIVTCTVLHDGMRTAGITPVKIDCEGWGWLRVDCLSRPDWPGFKRMLKTGPHALIVHAPGDAQIRIRLSNLFGAQHRTVDIQAALWALEAQALKVPAPRIDVTPATAPVLNLSPMLQCLPRSPALSPFRALGAKLINVGRMPGHVAGPILKQMRSRLSAAPFSVSRRVMPDTRLIEDIHSRHRAGEPSLNPSQK
jgi:hypothetical protein